jgi:hypothetical protein
VATKLKREQPVKRSPRTFLLRVRLSAEELEKLPQGVNLSRWIRAVIADATSGRRSVRPDILTLHQANAHSAWLGALLDELLREECGQLDRLSNIELLAESVQFQEGFRKC